MCNNDHFLFFSELFERLLTKFKVYHPLLFLSMVYIKPSYLFDSLMSLTLHRSLHYEQEEEPPSFGLQSQRPRQQFGLLLHRKLSKAKQSEWNNKISQLRNISTWKGVMLKMIKTNYLKLLSSISSGGPICLPWSNFRSQM